jgi:hypothetical protein
MNGEESGFTLSRFTTGIEQPRAFECQLLPTAKGVNSPKMELFNAVACHELGLVEFGHALDQNGQAVNHQQLVLFILDDRGKHELVSHVVGLCISTRIHLSLDPFQQLLKEARIYSSRRW